MLRPVLGRPMSLVPHHLSGEQQTALVYTERCCRDAGHYSELFDNATEKDNSLDRNKQKMFYIGESDNNDLSYRRTGRSPSNTARKRHTKGLREEKIFYRHFSPR